VAFLHLTERIPRKVCIALSGGADSMVGLDFCIKKGIAVKALHFNHGNDDSDKYEEFVVDYCRRLNVPIVIDRLSEEVPKRRSKEDFWREKRYDFFSKHSEGLKVVTCHHLDDAVETWVFSSMKGNPKTIPHSRGIFIRPFLLNKKSAILDWAEQNNVPFIQDMTNFDSSFDRNYIRNEMMSHVLRINPGIHKVIKKKILSSVGRTA